MTNVKTALITGASAGIGKAFAEKFAQQGFNLLLVARREELLVSLCQQLSKQYSIEANFIVKDLSQPNAAKELYNEVEEGGFVIDVLVNNAGYGIKKSFTKADWHQHDQSLHLMINTLTELCYLFVPGMLQQQYGRIINVSSLAAITPPFRGSLYSGIKSYVLHFSIALHKELRNKGVYCTAVCPGLTHTEFHNVMGVEKWTRRIPELFWMDVDKVVGQAYISVMKGKPMVINGLVNRVTAMIMRLIPFRLANALP